MNKEIKNNLYSMGILGSESRYFSPTNAFSLKKTLAGKDITKIGAVPDDFTGNDTLDITLSLPRRAGLCRARLVINADDGENFYYDFSLSSDYITDTFNCSVKILELPGGLVNGLYYYHLELHFGSLLLYTHTENNVDIKLSEEYPTCRGRLLVYDKNFKTPEWFRGNIMYQIFVDRFFKGTRQVKKSECAVINPDWESGIPQYGKYPGAFVANNMFFGGTLFGVAEKLEHLKELGVGCIYLCPIFKAYSNHKYDTGDYMTVDEMFGGEAALKELIEKASEMGIKIILDGVFNHTGDDSIYFNRYGRYDSHGAYENPDSPYRDWYYFRDDGKYESWWGIEILPKLNLFNPSCREYFLGKGGVLEKYLDIGISGIRLDVADELPDCFLDDLRKVVHSKKDDGFIVGEVWENAVDKVSYGKRRQYFRGAQLDSVMNYPLKNAIIRFVKHGDEKSFYNTLTELYSSYPKVCSDVLMNILGTHDTERILTQLGGESPDGYSNDELSVKRMTKEEKKRAVKMLKVASILQYTVFGTPSVYYGDEAGMQGYHDPFCRMPYPWSNIDKELLLHYKTLGKIRRGEKVFEKGNFEFCDVSKGFAAFRRYDQNGEILVLANTGDKKVTYGVDGEYYDLISNTSVKGGVCVPSMCAMILKKKDAKDGVKNG